MLRVGKGFLAIATCVRVFQILGVDEADELDEIAEGEAGGVDARVGADLDEGDRPDGKTGGAAEVEEIEGMGDGQQVGRDGGALSEGGDGPAFLGGELLEPGGVPAPVLPPRQFFAMASTASRVSLWRKSSASRARLTTNSAKSLIARAARACSRV